MTPPERSTTSSPAPRSAAPQSQPSERRDTARRKGKAMFNDIVEGKAVDSVVFDARNKMIYSYRQGDVTYQGMTLKADFMSVNMETKDIFAHGYTDSTETGEVMENIA